MGEARCFERRFTEYLRASPQTLELALSQLLHVELNAGNLEMCAG
jgi:hypothetical protein